jgi:hypothetical protein
MTSSTTTTTVLYLTSNEHSNEDAGGDRTYRTAQMKVNLPGFQLQADVPSADYLFDYVQKKIPLFLEAMHSLLSL